MERHAYINIEPNNGGIVLNVSDGGLCFHSFDPVQRNGTIRFWFSDQNQRIEADGTLAWTDETQKGGLRFTALPAEAREKIRNWMTQPVPATAAATDSAPAAAPQHVFPPVNVGRDRKAVPAPLPLVPPSTQLQASTQVNGFSRGLATGLLASVFVAGVFLFNGYRHEFGEWLIHLGEQFAAKPQVQTMAVSAAPPAALPAPQTAPVATPTVPPATQTAPPLKQAALAEPEKTSLPASVPVPVSKVDKVEKVAPQPERPAPPPVASSAKPQQAKLDVPPPVVATPTTVADPAPKPVSATAPAGNSLKPPAISVPPSSTTVPVASSPNPVPATVASITKPEAASQPGVHTEDSRATNADATSELYFEVGKFKNPLQAHDESDRLAQLGFPVTAVQKGFLWANSYHVLVGPYGDEEHAKATHQGLVSNGFKPRTFERGSRDFTLVSPVTLGGARTPEGEYTIRWESYIGDASVKFMRDNSVIAEADGKWVKHDNKYERDSYVYKRNPDGSRTLLEIHFEGMRQALVF
jgi:PilZ domain/SPOR domain